jgi:hypothetical protein
MSSLLRCAISAMAMRSGSREGDARGGFWSIPRRAIDRALVQSCRILRMSCHMGPSWLAESFRFVGSAWSHKAWRDCSDGKMRRWRGHLGLVLFVVNCRQRHDRGTKRLERHNYVTSVCA